MTQAQTDGSTDEMSYERFLALAELHLKAIEALRQKNLLKARLHLWVAPIIFALILLTLTKLLALLDAFLDITTDRTIETIILALVAFGFTAYWVVSPILRYRRCSDTVGDELITTSLKETIYNPLFQIFGDFHYQNLTDIEDLRTKGVSPARFHDAPHIPDYHEYRAEDWVKGVVDGAKVEFSEAEMIVHLEGQKIGIFRGMVMVIDVDEIDTKLRGKFSGKGALVADAKKMALSIRQHYEDYERLPLPDKWEAIFEAYATNPEEAKRVFNEALLERLNAISKLIQETPDQVTHNDDKLFWLHTQLSNALLGWFEKMVAAVFLFKKVATALLFERNNYFPLLKKDIEVHDIFTKRLNEMSKAYEVPFDVDKYADTLSGSQKSLNTCVEASYYDDRLVITIPYQQDIFEPNSLFEPALSKQDIKLLYELMQIVKSLTQNVANVKDGMNAQARSYN